MTKFFTPFFLGFFLMANPLKSLAQINTQDSLALVNLYNSTNGGAWANNSGWLTSPVSNWYGVTTSGNRVTAIDLSVNNLIGTIPASIGNGGALSNLTSLVLGTNQLTGAIPSSIGNLTSLNALVLGNNQFTSTIPTSFGNLINLTYLDLSSDQLTGTIPVALGNLTNLLSLYLYNNALTGSIPDTLGNLSNLGELELYSNQLTGSIPVSLGNLVSLTYMDLSSNQLTDTIPASFGTLFNLNILYLYNNQLTGSIPAVLGTLSNLQYISMGSNQLSGSIPSGLNSMSNLRGLSLSYNQLTGTIPSSLGKSSIFFMDLSHNLLSGTVPLSFTNLTNSSTVINYNQLTFDGLEQIAAVINGGILSDSPQAIRQLHLTGSKLSVYAGGTLANDTFHWYRNGVLDTTIIGDSTFTPILGGQYYVAVSNKIVTPASGLIIYSDTLSAGIILPITFLNFTGSLVNNNTLLQWQTGSEINTAYFTIQRSINGSSFTNIGRQAAYGNSTAKNSYHYNDDLSSITDQQATLFYRLQEVDINGSTSLSNVIAVQLNNDPWFCIYPNPVINNLVIHAGNNAGNALITIFNINGIKVLQQTQTLLQNSTVKINAANFAAGTYIVQLNINGSTFQQKFVKQ